METRLEFHADYQDFFRIELERLSGLALVATWEGVFEALSEESNPRFDGVVGGFCSRLEWPQVSGLDLARACARLHFALHRLPWEVTERPVNGEAYLRRMLVERYWELRPRWLVEAWGRTVLE